MSDTDWTTTEGCQRCNEYGPFEPGGVFYVGGEDAREAHKAWHSLVVALLPWQRLLLTTERVAHTLALPRRKP